MTKIHYSPMLEYDGSRADWPNGSYWVQADVSYKTPTAAVAHELKGAFGIQNLLDSNSAAYFAELRCPATLHTETYLSQTPSHDIEWDPADITGESFVVTGIVVTQSSAMPSEGMSEKLTAELGAGSFSVEKGDIIARGPAFRINSLASSLVEFALDDDSDDTSPNNGSMRTEDVSSLDAPRLRVLVSQGVLRRIRAGDRNLQVAGLVAACAALPTSTMSAQADGPHTGHPVALELRSLCDKEGMGHWDESPKGDFDPARLATAIEGFDTGSYGGEDDD